MLDYNKLDEIIDQAVAHQQVCVDPSEQGGTCNKQYVCETMAEYNKEMLIVFGEGKRESVR